MFRHCAQWVGSLYCCFCLGGSATLFAADVETSEATIKAKRYVRSALNCETNGDRIHRQKFLRVALRLAPDYAPANWHSGRVLLKDRWLRIIEAQARAAKDEILAEYGKLRARAGNQPERHLDLARWCARQGLNERSDLHYTLLLFAPESTAKIRQEAMRRLDLQDVGGVLLTEEEIKNHKRAADQVSKALKNWRPKLTKWHKAIDGGSRKKHDFAVEQLKQIEDPHIIAVIETFLGQHSEVFGQHLVSLLGRFGEFEATQSLVRFAVLSPSSEVRHAAVQQLKKRPQHEFIPMLLEGLVAPIQSQWRVAETLGGGISYQHVMFRAGPDEDVSFTTEHVATPRSSGSRHDRRPTLEGPLTRAALELKARKKEQEIEQANQQAAQNNEVVLRVLEKTTGNVLPREPSAWWEWWQNYNELYAPKQTQYLYQFSQSTYLASYGTQPRILPLRGTPQTRTSALQLPTRPNQLRRPGRIIYPFRLSCFVKGTPVWTETGVKPIELLKVGDRVLSQDPDTGELAFKLVTNATIRPPSDLARLDINDETVVTTKGHPFWVVGKGWRMAKLIEPDDRLHGLDGGLDVERVELLKDKLQAYNLEVADFATYFVGKQGILVHDNAYRDPTQALVPGLMPKDLTSSARR